MPAAAPRELLADLARRGFSVRAAGGGLAVTPASALTPVDREAIRLHRDGLLAVLSAREAWDPGAAHRLLEAADALVERLGVDGRQPAVTCAAAAVCGAYVTKDTETIRLACSEFEAVVRGLGRGVRSGQTWADRAGQTLPPPGQSRPARPTATASEDRGLGPVTDTCGC